MTEEFNLSKKIEENTDDDMEEYELDEDYRYWIYASDVKEFIRRLKEEIIEADDENTKIINQLAGDKLK